MSNPSVTAETTYDTSESKLLPDKRDSGHPHHRSQSTSRRRLRSDADDSNDVSMRRVTIQLYGLIAAFGWSAMANSYHSATVGRPEVLETSSDAVSGFLMIVTMFWAVAKNSVVYLASVPSVLAHTFTKSLAIPTCMLFAVVGVYVFAHWSRRVRREIECGFQKSNARRVGVEERKARARRR